MSAPNFSRRHILSQGAFVVASVAALPAGAKPRKKAAKTGIEWQIAPASVVIYLDGKRVGTAKSAGFTRARPGKHTVRLKNGGDETELEVRVAKGQVIRVSFTFTE